MMFNEIGRQSEGIIDESLDSVAYLVENYEQVGRVLLGLVGTYGTYISALYGCLGHAVPAYDPDDIANCRGKRVDARRKPCITAGWYLWKRHKNC